MSSVLAKPVQFHAARPAAAPQPEPRWSVDAIEALFNLPLPELMYQAQTVHRDNFNPAHINNFAS